MDASTTPNTSDDVETNAAPIAIARTDSGSRLHGRCPHCREIVIAHVARTTVECTACTESFPLLDILPLTRVSMSAMPADEPTHVS